MAGGYHWPPRLVRWPSAVSVLTTSRNDRPSPGRLRAARSLPALPRPARTRGHARRARRATRIRPCAEPMAAHGSLRISSSARPTSTSPVPGAPWVCIPGHSSRRAGVVPQLTAGLDGITRELLDLILPIMLRLALYDRDPPAGYVPRPSHLVQRHPGRGQRGVQPPTGPGRVRVPPQVAGAKAADASPGSARGLPHHQAGPMAANGSSMTSTRLASSSVTRPRSQAANILISAATDRRFSFPATRDIPPVPGYSAVCPL